MEPEEYWLLVELADEASDFKSKADKWAEVRDEVVSFQSMAANNIPPSPLPEGDWDYPVSRRFADCGSSMVYLVGEMKGLSERPRIKELLASLKDYGYIPVSMVV
jgi:hypothetical protein